MVGQLEFKPRYLTSDLVNSDDAGGYSNTISYYRLFAMAQNAIEIRLLLPATNYFQGGDYCEPLATACLELEAS
jgi:hypothetical protein